MGFRHAESFRRLKKVLFLLLPIVLVAAFFARNTYRSVDEIMPEVLREPIQQPVDHFGTVRFTRNGYAVELVPVARYQVSALVVGKMNYGVLSQEEYDRIFPLDLSLLWGGNAGSRVYKKMIFSNDMRWGWYRYGPGVSFNPNEWANTHLIARSPALEGKLKALLVGDQVKIRGSLVNLKALPVKQRGAGSGEITLNTSTTRTDSGAGSCEVMDVEEVEILRRGNPVADALFRFSLYALAVLTFWNVVGFFWETHREFRS